jgi:hypothetical protein
MNERIRQCWLTAAIEDSDDKWDTQEQFIERFAELIVRECAKLADEPTSQPHDSYGKKIRQHFGVEE